MSNTTASPLLMVIGNKNYSSWSLRPWLALRHCDVAFNEDRILLDHLDTAARIRAYSTAGRVPVLVHGDVSIWDSLAICEYLAERFPQAQLWPADTTARALARAISAEMHSGFAALRAELPMNVRASRRVTPSTRARADIARVIQVWTDCLLQFGQAQSAAADSTADDARTGWLFGAFSIADAMYAPVVLRLRSYHIEDGIEVSPLVAQYMAHVLADPAMQDWIAAALNETEVIDADERGAPV